jgi:proteasome accessory factor B
MSSSALSALNKLHAIGIESDTELLLDLAPAVINQDANLAIAISAITSKTVLSFSYLNEELQPQSRALEPYAVTSRYGHWYIFGNDLDRRANRLFRLDRVSGDLKLQGRSGAFEIPGDLDVNSAFAKSSELSSAIVFLRDGRGLNFVVAEYKSLLRAHRSGGKSSRWSIGIANVSLRRFSGMPTM